jgi:hypothetical protein
MRIKTIVLMKVSAVLLAVIGICLTFLTQEAIAFLKITYTDTMQLIIQLFGALFFGFAMLNWMAKGAVMGGIYNRPVTIANFAHFFIGALAIIKALIAHPDLPLIIWIVGGVYSIFALLFAIVLNTSPVKK